MTAFDWFLAFGLLFHALNFAAAIIFIGRWLAALERDLNRVQGAIGTLEYQLRNSRGSDLR